MSLGDIVFIICALAFCINLIGSLVMMILAYRAKKRQLDNVRHIIRMKEYEIFGTSEEVKK